MSDELPGMLALEKAVHEQQWPHTLDAAIWAKEWMKAIKGNPEIPHDEGAMISWFSNAIMAGYDSAYHAIIEIKCSSVPTDEKNNVTGNSTNKLS